MDTAFWAVISAAVYFVFKYLLRLLMPFFLALVIAAAARPVACFLSRETRYVRNEKGEKVLVRRTFRLNRTAAGVISVAALFVTAGCGLTLTVIRTGEGAAALISAAPGFYENSVAPGLARLYDCIPGLTEAMAPPVKRALAGIGGDLIADLGGRVTDLSARAVTWLTTAAARLPGFLLNTVICLIATVFIAADFDRIRSFIRCNLPERGLRIAVNVRSSFQETIRQIVRSYFIIFGITAAEISLGLCLIGIKKPVLIAFVIAVLDAFPVIGSGLVLLPWALIVLITGSRSRGLGLLALYLWVALFREIIEPRILGRRVGLRPLVTLMCMYAGARLFGGVGLAALPVMAAILADLNRNGVVRLYRSDGAETGKNLPDREES